MKASPVCRAFIKSFEHCSLRAYADPKTGGAPWTIGWGHTGREVHEGLVWTQKQCDDAFDQDLERFEHLANAAVIETLTQGEFDAFVSILFNVGPGESGRHDGIIWLKSGAPSTLLRKLNAGDKVGAAAEFERWISAGSSVENGLRRRRKAEVAMFRGTA